VRCFPTITQPSRCTNNRNALVRQTEINFPRGGDNLNKRIKKRSDEGGKGETDFRTKAGKESVGQKPSFCYGEVTGSRG